VVSTSVTVWLQRATFVQASAASHVRIATSLAGQDPALVTVLTIRIATFVPSQMSLAVGLSKLHGSPHSTVFDFAHTISGALVSTTVMVWLQVAALAQASIARHVRFALKVFPQNPARLVRVETTLIVTLVPSQPSLAVGIANPHGVPHSTTRSFAQVKLGGVRSTTEIVWLHLDEFVQGSTACQMRVAV
jgi:hypothetical protein